MKNKNLVEGINIIAKYLDRDKYNFSAGHDQIWFGDYGIVTKKDMVKLLELDWFEDEDSWSAFF